MNVSILDMELTKASAGSGKNPCVTFSLGMSKRMGHDSVMNQLTGLRGVILVEEL